MNAKISVFVICVKANIYLLLYNLHDCIFKDFFIVCAVKRSKFGESDDPIKHPIFFAKIVECLESSIVDV